MDGCVREGPTGTVTHTETQLAAAPTRHPDLSWCITQDTTEWYPGEGGRAHRLHRP